MKKNLSDRVKEAIAGDSFKEVEKKSGVAASTIGRYVSANYDPKTVSHLKKIANAYNVTVGWLANGEEPKHPEMVGENGNGEIAATISPGREGSNNHVGLGKEQSSAGTNVHMKHILGWMQEEIAGNDDKSLFFYEDIKERYPSFEEYMQKKRPSANSAAGPAQEDNRKLA